MCHIGWSLCCYSSVRSKLEHLEMCSKSYTILSPSDPNTTTPHRLMKVMGAGQENAVLEELPLPKF